MKKHIIILLFELMVIAGCAIGQNNTNATSHDGFTQSDRERLTRIEVTLEQHEKRFEELRADMNKHSNELRADMNKRFDEQHSTNTWIISLFTFLTATIITLAFWDRRSSLKPIEGRTKIIELAIEEIKSDKTSVNMLSTLREWAKTDPKVAELLKNNHLL